VLFVVSLAKKSTAKTLLVSKLQNIEDEEVVILLISPRTNEQLNLIIQQMFILNRILDRAVSIMSVKFCCVESSEVIHKKFAHKFPLLADQISEIQDAFNVLTDYLETPTDVSDYNSLSEMFERVLENVMSANDLITGAIEIANEESDINVKASLQSFLATDFIKYIKQSIILRDKAILYGDNILQFDRDINTFFKLE